MSIHYKFKSTLDFDTITFDGLHISVADLKKAIIQKKRFGKITDFDLQITNAQTKEEYNDDSILIPKNTSLIISRIPLVNQQKKNKDSHVENILQSRIAKVDGDGLDLSKMNGSEEDKILAMMHQSTADYDPKSYQRIRGQFQTGEVPATYRCNKCKKGGHWIKNCTFSSARENMDTKRNTGIPRSFRSQETRTLELDARDVPTITDKQQEIPEELICSICHDIFTDAVMIPCCGSSFCDDCVRTALLESEDNECPDCKEKGSSPGSLIPNRFLRNSVNTFRNETGYKNNTNSKNIDVSVPKKVDDPENVEPTVLEEPNKIDGSEEAAVNKCPSNENSPAKQAECSEIKEVENLERNNSNDTVNAKIATLNHEETESDFEDNITVTVPITAGYLHMATRDRIYNDNIHHPNPPGIERSPRNNLPASSQISNIENSHKSPPDMHSKEWEHDNSHMHHERNKNRNDGLSQQLSNISNFAPNETPRYFPRDPHDNIRPINQLEIFPVVTHRTTGLYHMPPHQVNQATRHQQHHQIVPFNNPYMAPRPCMGYQNYIRPVMQNPSSAYISNAHPILPHTNNLASVYQSVSAKVGTGIIDDPLEAFNRIMKEKEKRKEERRRSAERFRSKDREQRGAFRTSPYNRGMTRETRINRERSINANNERRHEYDHKKELDSGKGYHHKEMNSFSDRSTRSKSRSNSPKKKRSPSPIYKRTTQSRSNFRENRPVNKKYSSIQMEQHFNEQIRHSSSRQNQQHSSNSRYVTSTITTDRGYQNTKGHQKRSPFTSSSAAAAPRLKQEDSRPRITSKRSRDLSETLEPPPPGYEVTSSAYCSNWINSIHAPQSKYASNTQDLSDNNSHKIMGSKPYEAYHHRNERSRSRSSNRNVMKTKKKSRSLTPIRKSIFKADKKKDENLEYCTTKNLSEAEIYDRSDKNSGKASKPFRQECVDEYERHTNNICKPKEIIEAMKTKDKFDQQSNKLHASSGALNDNKDTEIKHLSKDEKTEKRKEKDRRKKNKKDRTERKKTKKEKKSKLKHKNGKKESCDSALDETILSYEEQRLHANDGDTPEKNDAYNNLLVISNSKLLLENKQEQPLQKSQRTEITSPTAFNRVDSILDIHEYETDFDEGNCQNTHRKINFKMPEISKWETDDKCNSPPKFIVNNYEYTDKAINAGEEEETIQMEHIPEHQSINSELQRTQSYEKSKGEMQSFQITVPASSSKERSVEIKNENRIPSKHTVSVKSVKDRLGVKVSNKKIDFCEEKSEHSQSNKSGGGVNVSSSLREDMYVLEKAKKVDKKELKDRHSEKTYNTDSNISSKKMASERKNNRHGHSTSSDNYNNQHRSLSSKGDRGKRIEKVETDSKYHKHSGEKYKYNETNNSVKRRHDNSNPSEKNGHHESSKNKQQCLEISHTSVNEELPKNPRSKSSSSLSINTASECDSSYDKPKTKKRKVKKEKKRNKRSSSVESSISAKKKSRKNKSMKKKKKSKK